MRLIGFALLLYNLSLAATCPTTAGSVVEFIAINTQETSCSVAMDMANVLTDVSQKLNMPILLSLSITGPNNNAGYDEGVLIQIPSQYIYRTGYEQTAATGTLSQLQTIVIHEFGHALLSQILHREFATEFGALFDAFNLDSKNRLNYLLDPARNTKPQQPRFDPTLFERFQTFISPYSELFADTVAVYYTNDLSALVNAMYFDELSQKEFKHLQLRDFKMNHPLDNPELEYDSHSKLAPTRTFIGKYMQPKSITEKQRLIRILASAIVTAAKDDLQLVKSPSAAAANRKLIKLLELSLRSDQQRITEPN